MGKVTMYYVSVCHTFHGPPPSKASANDAARRLGSNPRNEFMLDKAAAEAEILVDDEGRREEWRPVI